MLPVKVELGEESLRRGGRGGGVSGRGCVRLRGQGSLLEVTLEQTLQ